MLHSPSMVCCVSTSESTVRLPTCPPCICCLVSSSVNLGICAHIRPWLFIGTAMCQTSWAEAGSNQYAYVQMYLITTNDKTALASRQCLPTFKGASPTEASPDRLSALLSAAWSPRLSRSPTLALTKNVIFDHGAGSIG